MGGHGEDSDQNRRPKETKPKKTWFPVLEESVYSRDWVRQESSMDTHPRGDFTGEQILAWINVFSHRWFRLISSKREIFNIQRHRETAP